MRLQVKKLNQNAKLPTRNNPTDAGLDLYASEDMFIRLGATALVKTDIAILIPEGHVGKIEDRSGLAAKGLRTGAGVVDNGYTGEVKVVLHNLTHSTSGGYQIKAGDRIAQLLIYPVSFATAMEIDNLGDSQRKDSGFGSSGT